MKVDDNDIDGTFSFPNMQILTDTLSKHIDSSIDFKLKFSNSKKRVNLVTDTELIFLTIICEKKNYFNVFLNHLKNDEVQVWKVYPLKFACLKIR